MPSKARINFSAVLAKAFSGKFSINPTPRNFYEKYHSAMEDDVSYEAVRKWLNGKSTPNFDRICVISKWLDIDLNKFLDVITLEQINLSADPI
ncbi:MAG: hypothetical protein O2833_02270 [Proteobacteria bacterium]|nr:hypothetical protein [Pseudomonadota bacterium]